MSLLFATNKLKSEIFWAVFVYFCKLNETKKDFSGIAMHFSVQKFG